MGPLRHVLQYDVLLFFAATYSSRQNNAVHDIGGDCLKASESPRIAGFCGAM
jgi:hypothetical protein